MKFVVVKISAQQLSGDPLTDIFSEELMMSLRIREWLPLPQNGHGVDLFAAGDKLPTDAELSRVLSKLLPGLHVEAVLQDRDAIAHFLQVAAGVHPAVAGLQSIEQLRLWYAQGCEKGCVGAVIHRLFQRSILLYEKARMETDYFKHATTIPAALREVSQKIFGSPRNLAVLVSGVKKDAVPFLAELKSHGCTQFLFAGEPDPDEMPALQPYFSGHPRKAQTTSIFEACDILLNFDSVIPAALAGRKQQEKFVRRHSRPLLLFDATKAFASVPEASHIYYYTTGDLQKIIAHNLKACEQAAQQIQTWVETEIDAFYRWLDGDERFQFAGIIGSTREMHRIFELISRIARTDITVLIEGESGTGKELVARAIHSLSARADHEFVVVNCGAIPENLLESELFGHVRGAFTGAVAAKAGLFEVANGGTIFLDEIAELAPQLQVKLLRFLQDGEIKRVGSNQIIRVNVRVLAATNKNLAELVECGAFRSDLFYRVNVLQLTLPPLRERRSDIPLLAAHFLRRFAQRFHKQTTEILPEAMAALMAYNWPGNVRELENAIEHATALAVGQAISPFDLPAKVHQHGSKNGSPTSSGLSLKDLEKRHILQTLEACNWDYDFACKQLGIGRTTLWRKLKEYKFESAKQDGRKNG